MKVLITGGTGLVGQRLTKLLTADGYKVAHVSRSKKDGPIETFQWNVAEGYMDEDALTGVDFVVHLAGSGVAEGRWTTKRKQEILDSRVNSSELLFEKLQSTNHPLKGFVAASAVGYYGMDSGDKLCDEETVRGHDFLSDVVVKWEETTSKIRSLEIPTTQLRIGIVLDRKGGAIEKIETPIRFGLGAPLGSGKQWMSWIHVDDLCGMIKFAMENSLNGIYNAVAPNPVTNRALNAAVAKQMGRPNFMPNVPSFVLQMVFGEMATMILGGNKVSAQKIVDSGFTFSHSEIESALRNLYS